MSTLSTALGTERFSPTARRAVTITGIVLLLAVGAVAAYAAALNWQLYAQIGRVRAVAGDVPPPPIAVDERGNDVQVVPSAAQYHALGWAATLSTLTATAAVAGGIALSAALIYADVANRQA